LIPSEVLIAFTCTLVAFVVIFIFIPALRAWRERARWKQRGRVERRSFFSHVTYKS